ncbi:MAG TPA: glycosyltransferase family 2 protein [Acidobacteriaceae bacterium]|jgi:rhamnosyltransferase|nr:glycosyltransferase family 2 protein [Acidobacteriaceae bacterium]
MIAGIVILYYPDPPVLSRLVAGLRGQAQRLIAVDNTPGCASADVTAALQADIPVDYIPLSYNGGIGAAQNEGIRRAMDLGCSHVLLLDQDSAPAAGMIARLLSAESELLEKGEKVAAIGPVFIDGKTNERSCSIAYAPFSVRRIPLHPHSPRPVETANLIASGSLIRTSILQTVGTMRGDLFIDFVDTEWGLRARNRGYRCYCVPDAEMAHSTGDRAVRFFGKNLYTHSDLRNYYRIRNAIYLLRTPSMGWGWRTYMAIRIPFYVLLFPSLSAKKVRNIRAMFRAVLDGIRGRLGPAPESLMQNRGNAG